MSEPATKTVPLADLAIDLAKIGVEVTDVLVGQALRKTGFDVMAGVIKRTPVDTGRARGNWQAAVNQLPAVSDKSPEKGPEPPPGDPAGPTRDEGNAAMSSAKGYDYIAIANNAPHILVLDQGLFVPKNPGPSKDKRKNKHGKYTRLGRVLVQDGYSLQAPHGMVDLTIESIREEFNL